MVRQRARHRLIGAAVLVLLGVVGFSLLLDTEPRPLPVDIPIVIPAKAAPSAAKPAAAPAPATEPVPAAAAAGVAAKDSLGPREEVVSAPPKAASVESSPRPETKTETKTETRVEAKPDTKAELKSVPAKVAASPTDGDRARALLEGRNTDDKPAAGNQRIVVQVGAFADAARAREARLKLERAGLKTYTHVAETAEGKRIRVRVGPFATKAEADKAAARVKALGLPAAILTL